MDFLATYAAVNLDGALISKEITGIMGCQVGLSKDLYGSDLQAKSTSGTITLDTPPNSEIICGQNVGTKVVCGIIFFFEKKAMLKI